jgi:hypothetical protein
MYDDGDELDNLEDYYVFSRADYELTMKFEEMGWGYIGVRRRLDTTSSDKWASIVGWYEITGDGGNMQSFSTLTDAMRAHDACVVRQNGARTKRSSLNIPEDYREYFASGIYASEEGIERVDARNTRNTRKNVVSPESGSIASVKCEPNGYDDETVIHGEHFSDLLDNCESKKRRMRIFK